MKILVTGAAGFIGFHVTRQLLEKGYEVIGLDCINNYYDINLKFDRLKVIGIERDQIADNKIIKSESAHQYRFIKAQLEDKEIIEQLFSTEQFDVVINLAAQAGVRYSIQNPSAYINSNIVGFLNILEGCRHYKVEKLIYASSSSVYGLNTKMPLSPHNSTEHPMSLYAATKKSNELMAHSYSHLYGLSTIGLRFFTVYGPWGRPDMAIFLFTKAIQANTPIDVFNSGNMVRDFTYIDDIVESISKLCKKSIEADTSWNSDDPDPASSSAPYRIFNIGNSNPIVLTEYIHSIEKSLKKKAIKNMLPMQPGDVPETHADMKDLSEWINYKPTTSVQQGVKNFVNWYVEYYKSC
jgi:UDP-glucuronate 4-epimerase